MLNFVREYFIDVVAEAIGQNASKPDGEPHRPRKGYQTDIFLYPAGNECRSGCRFHEKRHRTGVFIGYAGTDETGTNGVDLNVIRQ